MVKSGMSEADAFAESQRSVESDREQAAGESGDGQGDAAQMASQALLGNVVESLRSKGSGGGSAAGAVLPTRPPSVGVEEVRVGGLGHVPRVCCVCVGD